MKLHRKWVIAGMAALVLLAGAAAVTSWYRSRPQYKARQLLAELRGRPPGLTHRALVRLGLRQRKHGRRLLDILNDLGNLGPGAVPPLIKALSSQEQIVGRDRRGTESRVMLHNLASTALGKIGRPAVPALAQALRDEDPLVRRCAAASLAMIGSRARAARAPLLEALKDDDQYVRVYAAGALAGMGRRSRALPVLLGALKSEVWDERCEAARVLGEIGPGAADAVPALMAALKDDHSSVRIRAAEALVKVGRVDQGTRALIELLQSTDWSARQDAALALGNLGPMAQASVRALKEALKDENEDVRQAAAEALARIRREKPRKER